MSKTQKASHFEMVKYVFDLLEFIYPFEFTHPFGPFGRPKVIPNISLHAAITKMF